MGCSAGIYEGDEVSELERILMRIESGEFNALWLRPHFVELARGLTTRCLECPACEGSGQISNTASAAICPICAATGKLPNASAAIKKFTEALK